MTAETARSQPVARWYRAIIWPAKHPVKALVGLAAVLVLAILGLLAWLDTDSGHRFIARQVAALEFENGMQIKLGAIEGSIYNQLMIRDLAMADPQGEFVSIPQAKLDWQPFGLLRSHVNIHTLTAGEIMMQRMPAFKETVDSGDPLLPDWDIDIGKLDIGRLKLAAGVTGRPHIASLQGSARIANRRAQIALQGETLTGQNLAGGDTLSLKLDAVPEDNKLAIALDLNAPADGLVAGLSGIPRTLALQIDGQGTWEQWHGTLQSSSGGQPVAALALSAQAGRFGAQGNVQLHHYVAGLPFAALMQPAVAVDISALAEERQITLDGSLKSPAMSLTTNGLIDLGENRFSDLALTLQSGKQIALAGDFGGTGMQLHTLWNGTFHEPDIAYDLTAGQLAYGDISAETLTASGMIAARQGRIDIPLTASAARIIGIGDDGEKLLQNVRLAGHFSLSDNRLETRDLTITSDQIKANASLIADLSAGKYTGALTGTVNGYQLTSIGVFNVEAGAKLQAQDGKGFAINGMISARSEKIFSAGAEDFLGGATVLTAQIGYGSDRHLRISNLAFIAPRIRLNNGAGSYGPGGDIAFLANGQSSDYGPFSLDISGTAAQIIAKIAAPRPGLGIGVANLLATVRNSARGYDISTSGQSNYGDFDAELGLLDEDGQTVIAIDRAQYSGMVLTGRLKQSPSGPFAGLIKGNGAGFDASIALSPAAGEQRAIVTVLGKNARLDGPAGGRIGHAAINADILLGDQPNITAEAHISDATLHGHRIAAARGQIEYANGHGNIKLLAEGRSTVPFRIAVNGGLGPDLWRLAINGRANGLDFNTASPLRIKPMPDGYAVLPSAIQLAGGTLQLRGQYGSRTDLKAKLAKVELAALNVMWPELGFGGKATGTFDYAQPSPAAFPQISARLAITNFTRSDVAAASVPLDMQLAADFGQSGSHINTNLRRNGVSVGQLRATLGKADMSAATWTAQLAAAPLTGGIRFNGPANALFSLAALPDQSLAGQLGVAGDFSGTFAFPRITGVVQADNLTYENNQYGTKLTRIKLRGRFLNDKLDVTELTAQAGDGTITGKGTISLSSELGFPMQLNLDLKDAQLARNDALAASASGIVGISKGGSAPLLIKGALRLPETRYKIVRSEAAQVPTLSGIRRKGTARPMRINGDADPISSAPTNWALDLKLTADDKIYVTGMGIDSEWSADLTVKGTTAAPIMGGQINLKRGTLDFASRSFDLTEGELVFNDGSMANPTIRLTATSKIDGVAVQVNVRGSGNAPRISFSSTPNLPQDEIMARILFGSSVGELSAVEAIQLAASANALRGTGSSLNPLGVIQSAIGVDRLRIVGPDSNGQRGSAIALGQYITNDIYVEIVTDSRGYTASQIEVSLTPALSILSQVGSFGGSNVNIRFKKDY